MSIQIFKNYEHILRESKCAFSISKKKGGNEIKMVVGLTEIKETELENMTMNLKPNEIKNKEEGTMKLSLYESRIFGRISYGYARDEKGIVYIKEDEAEIVKWMYQMCIAGHSLLQIQAELLRNGIKSPSGKEEWPIVSAFAQAESESISMNITRGKRMGFREGKFPFPFMLYGFRKGENGQPEIDEQEAKIVRKIFYSYIEGKSLKDIQKLLQENEIDSPTGNKVWSTTTLSGMLKNEKYMGDALLQKTYTVDFLTKKIARNKGEVAEYYVENSHQGIVSKEIFNLIQDEIKRRSQHFIKEIPQPYSSQYALTGKVYCGECGSPYRRVTWSKKGKKKIVWRCTERLRNGTKNCKNSPSIPENDLHDAILNSIKGVFKEDSLFKEI